MTIFNDYLEIASGIKNSRSANTIKNFDRMSDEDQLKLTKLLGKNAFLTGRR